MSEENDSKPEQESTPTDSTTSDESAAAAKEAAKDFANNAGAVFKGLDQKMQIYLVALAVTLLCSLIFGTFKAKMKMSDEMKKMNEASEKMAKSLGVTPTKSDVKKSKSETSPAMLGLDHKGGWGGKIGVLGAVAGIGILLWSTFGKRKDTWIPLGLAGAAGVAVLGILITRTGLSSVEFMGTKISYSGTLLGWWLPFAGAVTAAVVSVQRILKA